MWNFPDTAAFLPLVRGGAESLKPDFSEINSSR
jgi:hypothetical protein